MGQCKQCEQISAIAKTKSSRTVSAHGSASSNACMGIGSITPDEHRSPVRSKLDRDTELATITQILSSIKVYLAESGGALPFKFTRLLKTIGPKLAIKKLNAGTLEHQHIMLFVTQLTDIQVSVASTTLPMCSQTELAIDGAKISSSHSCSRPRKRILSTCHPCHLSLQATLLWSVLSCLQGALN